MIFRRCVLFKPRNSFVSRNQNDDSLENNHNIHQTQVLGVENSNTETSEKKRDKKAETKRCWIEQDKMMANRHNRSISSHVVERASIGNMTTYDTKIPRTGTARTTMNMMTLMMLTIALFFPMVVVVLGEGAQKLGDLKNPDGQVIQLSEDERLAEYKKRNYQWPLSLEDYKPATPGWKALMEERFQQVQQMPTSHERYEGYYQTTRAAMYVQNFTEYGFGLARCPDDLLHALQTGIRQGLPTATYEPGIEAIEGPRPPLFVERPDLTERVLTELQHYAETWAGVPLTPYRAYGFRLYQNNSQLHMHVDKVQTHIVSFILHIDSSEDAEPWPIFIEDFHGRTHEVILTPGDILFYESSKCFHGRPRRFNGGWYSSLFVHYYPTHGWYDKNHALEAHYTIPPVYATTLPESELNYTRFKKMKMVGTTMYEPDCPNNWCRSAENTIQWSGPGQPNVWIAPSGETYPFHPQPVQWQGPAKD